MWEFYYYFTFSVWIFLIFNFYSYFLGKEKGEGGWKCDSVDRVYGGREGGREGVNGVGRCMYLCMYECMCVCMYSWVGR